MYLKQICRDILFALPALSCHELNFSEFFQSASGQRRARVSLIHAAPTSVLDTWPPRPTSWSSSQVVLWLTQAMAWLQPSRTVARSLARSSEVARIVHEVGSDVGETLHDLAPGFPTFWKTWRDVATLHTS